MNGTVLHAAAMVTDTISPVLTSMDPLDQKAVDSKIHQAVAASQGLLCTSVALAVSMAVCRAGAAAKGVPLHQHIADLAGITQLHMPVPGGSCYRLPSGRD